jgi:hypothetical protein
MELLLLFRTSYSKRSKAACYSLCFKKPAFRYMMGSAIEALLRPAAQPCCKVESIFTEENELIRTAVISLLKDDLFCSRLRRQSMGGFDAE